MDISSTIVAKSDQLNADDMVSGNMIIKITAVKVKQGSDQPISIYYEGDNGKPWKPCLTMRRVLVKAWGNESDNFVGKSIELYRDDTVTFGKMKVGGIRITAVSDIPKQFEIAVNKTRGRKIVLTIEKLNTPSTMKAVEVHPITDEDFSSWKTKMDGATTLEQLLVVHREIKKVAGAYDTASKEKLSAYYKDIKMQLTNDDETL